MINVNSPLGLSSTSAIFSVEMKTCNLSAVFFPFFFAHFKCEILSVIQYLKNSLRISKEFFGNGW
jgi:hypothetical protein